MSARIIKSRYESFILKISIGTKQPEEIKLVVADADQDFTMFTNRIETVNGKHDFYVRIPVSGANIKINVFNTKNGNQKEGIDKSFVFIEEKKGDLGIQKLPLERKLDAKDITPKLVRDFIHFAQRWSFNAGVYPGGLYQSKNGNFFINYVDGLLKEYDEDTNEEYEVQTPFRICKQDGLIEASKKQVKEMTVSMRMALLLHEFSHFWLNQKMEDEVEADIRALQLYLSLGYPVVEAYDAFYEVFANNNTPENQQRAKIIDQYIQNFQSTHYFYYD